MTRSEALEALRRAGVPDAAADLRKLERFADGDLRCLAQSVLARAERQPMSHILGYRDFWNHRFRVLWGNVLHKGLKNILLLFRR